MTDDNKPKEFFCNGCGQIPCTGNCEELCAHGVMKRDYCDDCHNKLKEWRELFLCDGHAYTNQSDAEVNSLRNRYVTIYPVHVVEKSALTQAESEIARLENDIINTEEMLRKLEFTHEFTVLKRESLAKENAELKEELAKIKTTSPTKCIGERNGGTIVAVCTAWAESEENQRLKLIGCESCLEYQNTIDRLDQKNEEQAKEIKRLRDYLAELEDDNDWTEK